MLHIEQAIALYCGGEGSGCNPEKGKCGRTPGGGKPYNEWSQEDKNLDWAQRHGLPIDDRNRVRLYHATPLATAEIIDKQGLKKDSFLTDDPETALQQAGRDRGLKAGKLAVYEAWVPLGTFHGGTWAQTMKDLSPDELSLKRRFGTKFK